MLMNEIMQDTFYAKRCRRIQKWIEVRGVQILLLAMVEGRTDTQLWYMSRSQCRADLRQEMVREGLLVEDYTQMTNRQYLLLNMREDSCGDEFSMDSITFNGTQMKVLFTEGSGFYESNIKNWMALQFFYEQGMDISPWDTIESDEIMLNCTTLQADNGGDVFTALGAYGPVEVAIIIGETSRHIPLNAPLRFTVANNESKIIHYSDPLTGKLRQIHIKGIEIHDMWAIMEQNMSAGWGSQVPEAERKQTLERMEDSMQEMCPKGKVYALLVYEEEENRQLEFYETAHLDNFCVIGNTVSSIGFFGHEDGRGPNGHPYRLAPIRIMDPGEVEVFEVELLGVYVMVEGERVEV